MTVYRPIDPPTNALALAGLWLGIIACTIALVVPSLVFAMFLAFIPGLLAIIFGFIGINTGNRMRGHRVNIAVFAVILGFTPIVWWFIGGFFISMVFGVSRSALGGA